MATEIATFEVVVGAVKEDFGVKELAGLLVLLPTEVIRS